MVSSERDVSVVVVGAGLSGLRAAVELEKAGISYVVLEAMDRVGGRTLSSPASLTSEPGLIELGAAWLNDTNQSEMYALAQEFGFKLVKQRTEGISLYQDTEGNTISHPYDQPLPLTADEAVMFQGFLGKISEYVDRSNSENPHLGPDAEELDSMTVQDFADRTLGGGLASAFTTSLTRALLGVEAHELSALFFIDFIASGAGIINIIGDSKDNAQYLRNGNGNQSFASGLAAKLNKDRLQLSHPVKSIFQGDASCLTETYNGTRYRSKKVILSVPSNMYPQIQFFPPLPLAKQTLGKLSTMGYYSKTVLIWAFPWWHAEGLSGVLTSDEGPISFSRDTCVPERGQYSITCFHIGDPGRNYSQLPDLTRRRLVWDQFRHAFQTVVKDIPEPINIIEKEWTKEPWVRGNPVPVMVPGIMTSEAGKTIRDPFNHVHFIGAETSLAWKGYMEGAVRSGVRGANEVISKLEITPRV